MKTSHSIPNSRQASASAEPHWPAPVSVASLRTPAALVVVGLRDGGVRLVRAGRRDALVLVVDVRRGVELALQPAGAVAAASGARACRSRAPPRGSRSPARPRPPARSAPSGRSAPGPRGRPAALVPGWSGGSGSPGRSGSRLTQLVGISDSSSRYFVGASRRDCMRASARATREGEEEWPAIRRPTVGSHQTPGTSVGVKPNRVSGDPQTNDDIGEPILRVPEERTPLPDVDRALPVLELVAAAVSRKRGRFNVAALKSLQESGNGRWKIKGIQGALDWLEPQSATDIVGALRASGMLHYDPLANRYECRPRARARRRWSRTGAPYRWGRPAPDDPLHQQGNVARARRRRRRRDRDLTVPLRGSRCCAPTSTSCKTCSTTTATARCAKPRTSSTSTSRTCATCSTSTRRSIFRHRGEPELLHTEKEGRLGLVADLGNLCARVVGSVSHRADERMRSHARSSTAPTCAISCSTTRDELATLVEGNCVDLLRLPWLPADELLAALEDAAGHHATPPPPLPEPEPASGREAPQPQPTETELMLDELARLSTQISLRELVVRDSWGRAVRRSTALLDGAFAFGGRAAAVHGGRRRLRGRLRSWRLADQCDHDWTVGMRTPAQVAALLSAGTLEPPKLGLNSRMHTVR